MLEFSMAAQTADNLVGVRAAEKDGLKDSQWVVLLDIESGEKKARPLVAYLGNW
jgi:hypothetical protein